MPEITPKLFERLCTENHEARLAAMNLKYGATAVFRDSKGTFWATGDYAHCFKNIDHNIAQMVTVMQAEKLTYMGKAYNSDIYKSKAKITDWQSILETLGDIFRECPNHLTAVNPKLPIEAH